MIFVIMVMTVAFAISSLSKNSTVATGVGVALFFGANLVTSILGGFQVYWGRYLFFSNTDLLAIKNGMGLYYGMTVLEAIINLCIHWFVFMLIAYDGFVRREV